MNRRRRAGSRDNLEMPRGMKEIQNGDIRGQSVRERPVALRAIGNKDRLKIRSAGENVKLN
ncbi:MAG: hypothetical protein OXC66_14240 [Roseovarius sp.]|nr:hypothetical protein [Roseovarius sp.]